MDKSQRRVTEKNEEGPGRRLKLIAVLTLAAVAAAGYFAFDYSRTSPGARPGGFFATGSAPDRESAAGAAARTPRDLPRGQRADNSRRLADDTTRPEELRPGYTMAEHCAAGADGRSYACEAGSYDDGVLRPAARGASASRPTQGYTISGRVLTAAGAGLGGITLVAAPERLAGEAEAPPGKLRFWTVTDALGAYSLDGLPDGEYTIRSRAQGAYPSARISARAGVDYADLVIAPQLAVVAEGTVITADGAPLEGVTVAPVLPGQASVTSDDDGRFSLPVTVKPAVRGFALRFQRPGFQEATGEFDIASGAPLAVVLQPVEAWTSVKGRFRGEAGEKLAGRSVELRPQAGAVYAATTDKEGRFAFPAVESPADYRLVALGGPDHQDAERAVHVTADVGDVDLVAPAYRFGRVRGHVANLDGEPVPGLELVLRNSGSRAPNALVRTDADGDFDVPSAPAGRLVVASQSAPAILVGGLELEPGATLELPLVLDLGSHEIHGRVVDARGEPVTASRIVMQWSHESGGITTRTTRRAAADADGRFAFSRLGPGPHALTIEAPGFPAVTVEHDVGRGYDLTVQLKTDAASARAALTARTLPIE